jgi:tRNA-dihydrouridine synthase A
MVGRAAYHDPWAMTAWDTRFLAAAQPAATDRDAVEVAMVRYMEREAQQHGTPWPTIARHMLGLRLGTPGARRWRQVWSDHARKAQSPGEVSAIARRAARQAGLAFASEPLEQAP